MAGKNLVTESCVRAMAHGSELVLDAGKIATPSALDLAFERGIRVTYAHEMQPARQPQQASQLWSRLKSEDGTYVVVVKAGRAAVTRVTERGADPIGEEG